MEGLCSGCETDSWSSSDEKPPVGESPRQAVVRKKIPNVREPQKLSCRSKFWRSVTSGLIPTLS